MLSVRIRSFAVPYFPALRLNTERYLVLVIWSISPYSVRMQENMDQKSSKYEHFLRIVIRSPWSRFSCWYFKTGMCGLLSVLTHLLYIDPSNFAKIFRTSYFELVVVDSSPVAAWCMSEYGFSLPNIRTESLIENLQ